MDYNFEALGDQRFQKLCQAILVATFPNVQCLPVDQPDGGRDAFHRYEGGFVAYQVKYSRNPSQRTERDSIENLIKREQAKVKRLIERGATAYYLLTNISGTSHLDVGSIDKVNQALTTAFGIPVYCWWRDDLERRLEVIPSLIWRYPEVARGLDFLEVLGQTNGALFSANRTSIFRSYVATQWSRESEVRFQQVQIQNSLFDLFTDTPIGESREKQPSAASSGIPEQVLRRVQGSYERARYGYLDLSHQGSLLAADWLMSAAPTRGVQRIVLEGAPGQGKSTVTQYMCQVHRLKVLRLEEELEGIPEPYRRFGVRLPLRVDLRDYATWLLGKDPFATDRDSKRPPDSSDALESFLAYQVQHLSGGLKFSADDIVAIFSDTHALLVLDGFDEVADIPLRGRLIEQIRGASSRLGSLCASIQVVVTSRPAAFILSPGFPEREWSHYRLLPMEPPQISEYSDKWMEAKSLAANDRWEFKELVVERTNRPHIKILSQNPMQLAILLWLISTKGRSLPDKRTALYDSYMDLFFGREAEKDPVVRDNRDIIVQIHEFIAWKLQADAEAEGSAGAIPAEELKDWVYAFLTNKEHPTSEVLKLFSGVVERVGALVSRVQGTVEFEVQPLREYFAAKHLYLTAPYSPPGDERRGTKPQRFDALSRRPYWSNVTRFYAGCYSSGELASLLAGIESLHDEERFRFTSHTLQLAIWLLNDWVFTQEPRTVKSVIRFLTKDGNLKLLMSSRSSWEDARLSLPDKCGRADFAVSLIGHFLTSSAKDYISRLGFAVVANTSHQERWQIWATDTSPDPVTFERAKALSLFSSSTPAEAQALIAKYGSKGLHALVEGGKWDLLGPPALRELFEYTMDGFREYDGAVYYSRPEPKNDPGLYLAYTILGPSTFSPIHYNRLGEASLADILLRQGRLADRLPDEPSSTAIDLGYHDFVQTAARVAAMPVNAWASEIEPWSLLIESARRVWGDRLRLQVLAAIAAGIKSSTERAAPFSNLLEPSLPLAERARHARLRNSVAWWREQLSRASSSGEREWILLLLLSWAPGALILQMRVEVQNALEAASAPEWHRLHQSLRMVVTHTGSSRAPISKVTFEQLSEVTSFRLLACLFPRLPKLIARQVWLERLVTSTNLDEEDITEIIRYGFYEASREQKIWMVLLNFIKSYPQVAAAIESGQGVFRRLYIDAQSPMPEPVALAVMEDMDTMPLYLVAMAEERLNARATGRPSPLKAVAEAEKWFA
ncbi:MAG TPA: hypothetical protein VD846_05940 [Allosphingosinicella sp.]|nr:hypothetical protein [Allosphingosinicella sp.]